jgi:hypothetical protein
MHLIQTLWQIFSKKTPPNQSNQDEGHQHPVQHTNVELSFHIHLGK